MLSRLHPSVASLATGAPGRTNDDCASQRTRIKPRAAERRCSKTDASKLRFFAPLNARVSRLAVTHRQFFFLLAACLLCSVAAGVHADDQFVKAAKLRSAYDFDKALPRQPIVEWLRVHLPWYETSWGEHITDCGEGTGSAADRERDMPLCAEIGVKDGPKEVGYLALLVATQKRGLLQDGIGLHSGYLEHHGTRYDFKRLSDVLKVR